MPLTFYSWEYNNFIYIFPQFVCISRNRVFNYVCGYSFVGIFFLCLDMLHTFILLLYVRVYAKQKHLGCKKRARPRRTSD